MSNEIYVNQLNEKINYEEGKIYWKWNKHWSSKLMDELESKGWKITEHKSGLIDIYDNAGDKIVWGIVGRANALYELAKTMR